DLLVSVMNFASNPGLRTGFPSAIPIQRTLGGIAGRAIGIEGGNLVSWAFINSAVVDKPPTAGIAGGKNEVVGED
ncbi:MAG: hypothetical protein ACRYG8_13580, partial [Janthinobacterium lividum]